MVRVLDSKSNGLGSSEASSSLAGPLWGIFGQDTLLSQYLSSRECKWVLVKSYGDKLQTGKSLSKLLGNGFNIHVTIFVILLTTTSHRVSISCSDFADKILRWHRVQLYPIPGRSTGNLFCRTFNDILESQNFVLWKWKKIYLRIILWPVS